MKGKSFFEILEDQLRKDLRAEIEAEVRAEMGKNKKTSQHPYQDAAFQTQMASGTAESWLVSHLGKTLFSRRKEARRAYQVRPTARPQTTVVNQSVDRTIAREVEPSIHLSAAEDLIAIEFLRRHSGVRIGATLTRSELKQAWRKAALKTHPDRYTEADTITQTRMKAIFQEICTAYERIENHFNSARNAA